MSEVRPPATLERDLARAEQERFDLVVVGAGIYGIMSALEASRSGLKV
ncbi:MAG: hypothetical protein AAF612_04940 [Planctomycetota bacterium]